MTLRLYDFALLGHLTGVLMLTAGVSVSLAAKAMARRAQHPAVVGAMWELGYQTVRLIAFPGSLLLVAAGASMVSLSHGAWSLTAPWIIGAMSLWIVSALIGIYLHGPLSRAVRAQAAAEAAGGSSTVSNELRTLLQKGIPASTADTALLFVMVTLMVFKPG